MIGVVETFIARQPIFDRKRHVIGYELLFRNGLDNAFDFRDGTGATSQVMINSFCLFGMQALTGGRNAFVNVTREILVNDYIFLFPRDQIIPEILENIRPDPEVLAACRRLKAAGYLIALDDLVQLEGYEPFVELADILKVDFRATSPAQQQRLIEQFRRRGVRVLAEKVETQDEYTEAYRLGYDCFQGFFFATPEVLSRREFSGHKLHYMQLMQQLHRPDLDFDDLEGVVKRDVSLSYRLLRYINSAFFGRSVEIASIRQALVLLGKENVKKFATLVAISCMSERKPTELLVTALARAQFCESLASAARLRDQAPALFLMGMFSVLDAIMDLPLEKVLESVPIEEDIADSLSGKPGQYRDILDIALCLESGDWGKLARSSERLHVPQALIPDIYVSAVDWAHQNCEEGALVG